MAATRAAHRMAFSHSPKTYSLEHNVLRSSHAHIFVSMSFANLAAPCMWEDIYPHTDCMPPHRVGEARLHSNGAQSPNRCWQRPGFLYECSGPKT
jgi:hypothetical protein